MRHQPLPDLPDDTTCNHKAVCNRLASVNADLQSANERAVVLEANIRAGMVKDFTEYHLCHARLAGLMAEGSFLETLLEQAGQA